MSIHLFVSISTYLSVCLYLSLSLTCSFSKALEIARSARDCLGGNGIVDEYHIIRHVRLSYYLTSSIIFRFNYQSRNKMWQAEIYIFTFVSNEMEKKIKKKKTNTNTNQSIHNVNVHM